MKFKNLLNFPIARRIFLLPKMIGRKVKFLRIKISQGLDKRIHRARKTHQGFLRLRIRKILFINLNRILFIISLSLFSIALLFIGLNIYLISLNGIQKERISGYDEMAKVASTISSFFITSSFVLTALKYAQESYINRTNSGHEFLVNTFLGRITDLREKLSEKIDPYNIKNLSYYDCVDLYLLDPYDGDDILIKSLLNNLEYLCLAIHEGVIDEQIARDAEENLLFVYWKWFYPYIMEMRINHYDEAWAYIDVMVRKWKPKEAEEVIKSTTILLHERNVLPHA
jgi:hypothetical protein